MSYPAWRRTYDEGWAAYLDGISTNPYSYITQPVLASYWRRGYNDSERQNK